MLCATAAFLDLVLYYEVNAVGVLSSCLKKRKKNLYFFLCFPSSCVFTLKGKVHLHADGRLGEVSQGKGAAVMSQTALQKTEKSSFALFKKMNIYMNNQKCCSMHARPAVGDVTL